MLQNEIWKQHPIEIQQNKTAESFLCFEFKKSRPHLISKNEKDVDSSRPKAIIECQYFWQKVLSFVRCFGAEMFCRFTTILILRCSAGRKGIHPVKSFYGPHQNFAHYIVLQGWCWWWTQWFYGHTVPLRCLDRKIKI